MTTAVPAGFPGYPLPAYAPTLPLAAPDDDALWWTVAGASAGVVVALAGLAWHAVASARERAGIRREVQAAAADFALYRSAHALEHVAIAEAQAARDAVLQAQLDDLTAVSPFAASGLPSVRTLSRLATLAQGTPSRAPTLRSTALPVVSAPTLRSLARVGPDLERAIRAYEAGLTTRGR